MFIATQYFGRDWHSGPAAAMAEPTWMTHSDTSTPSIDALQCASAGRDKTMFCDPGHKPVRSVVAFFNS
jgi:hypothetical protein